MEIQTFSTCKKNTLQTKFLLKKPKIPPDIMTLTNLKVSTQAKISSFKNPPMKIGLLLPRGQNPLSY
jgi:hypothetical protein